MKENKKRSRLFYKTCRLVICIVFFVLGLQMVGKTQILALEIPEYGEYDEATETLTLYSIGDDYKILPSTFRNLFTDELKGRIKNLRIVEKDGRKFRVVQPGVVDHMDLVGTLMGCEQLETVDLSGLDASYEYGIDMTSFFEDCISLKDVKWDGFDATNVVCTKNMFRNCKSLESMDMTRFVTSEEYLYEIPAMFEGCTNLQDVKLGGIKTQNVTLMRAMFKDCVSLKALDLRGFDTQNVQTAHEMFMGCTKLEMINLSDTFTFPKATNLQRMFYNCKKLKSIDVKNWDSKNVTHLKEMFLNCQAITQLNLSTMDTSQVDNAANRMNMFKNMKALKELTTCSTSLYLPIFEDAKYAWVEKDNPSVGYLGGDEITKKATLIPGVPEFSINYVTEKGTLESGDTSFVWYAGTKNLAVAVPLGKHDQFDGWYLDADQKNKVAEIAPRTLGDVTLYAKWNVQPHDMTKLAYNENGHWYVCSICGEKEKTVSHVYSSKKDATCNVCDYIRAVSEAGTSGNNLENRSDLPLLLVKGAQGKGNEIKLNWNKFGKEKGYEIYWSYCNGKRNFKLFKSQKGTSFTHKNLEKDRAYKYFVVAYTKVKGKKVYLSKTPTIHVAMKSHGGTNIKSIKLDKKEVTLALSDSYTIKASYTKQDKKKNVINHCATLRYKSGNTQVATVNKKGVVKAKRKGSCTIFVSAANGVTSKLKVTVQ